MLGLSDKIDSRINDLTTTYDDLQVMEVTVRDYNDKLQHVSEQFDRLEKQSEVIDRIAGDVSSSWDNLKELEQRLIDSNRQVVSLPQEIKEVQSNVDRILKNGPKITDAIGKLENLDVMMNTTQKKLDELTSVQNGLKQTELKLEQVNRELDDKYKVLRSLTQNKLQKEGAPSDTGIAPSVRETIRALKREGWTIQEIASRFKRTPTEIELLLELPD
mgnify:FL=1